MLAAVSATIDRLRQPEYTGENRCIPCTAVNVVLAAIGSIVVGIVGWTVDAPLGVVVGIIAFLLASGAIYLRGYLVPGTPWLTKRYFPDRVLRWFDKAPTEELEGTPDDFDIERTLVDAGVVEECVHADDLCLEAGFEQRWNERIREVRTGDATRDELATLLEVNPEDLSFDEHGDAFVARFDGRRVGQWESRAAFVADMAAAQEVAPNVPGWSALDIRQRSALLDGLRLFLERCPDCDGSVSLEEETVESCCRSIDVVAVSCDDCGARLFEAEVPG